MLEIGTSGTVRGGGGNIFTYSEQKRTYLANRIAKSLDSFGVARSR
jgi:hypothetical protein